MSSTPERLRSVHTPDGAVVLDVHAGKMFSLNRTASLMFRLFEQGATEENVVDALVAQFHVSAEVAHADTVEFCGALERLGLLKREK